MIFWAFFILICLVGATLGSFTTAIVYRVKNNQSWIFADKRGAARSACPNCDEQLQIRDLIPIFSWAILKGKCRYCSRLISKQYILTEILSVMIAVLLFLSLGIGVFLGLSLIILPFALAQLILIYQNRFISVQLSGIIALLLVLLFILYT